MSGAAVDWWGLYHKAMTELPWATPAALGRLTLPQLACLGSATPPGAGEAIRSAEDLGRVLAERARAEAAWRTDRPDE